MAKRKPVKKKQNSVQTAFTRFMFIVAFFTVWIGVIGVRLVHLQVTQHSDLREKAVNQRRDEFKDRALRGTIFDRSERALAISLKAKSLFVDPTEIADIDVQPIAYRVAHTLNLKANEVFGELRKAKDNNRRFVWLARKLDEQSVNKINNLNLDVLHWKEEQTRSYPHGVLASHIIGFSNSEEVGQAGIELSQEKYLHGETVEVHQDKDRLGRVFDREETEERKPPKDIVLTIDYAIQYKTEQALARGVANANAKSGTAVVLNPKNGEILAMATVPTFDPNKYGEVLPDNLKNRAIQDYYTPGSTFKLVTYSSAIEAGLIKPEGTIDVSKGFIKVADREISDSHKSGVISYAEAFAVSSNVAAVTTGLRVGKQNFFETATKFGFGQTTGIELPAETGGILHPIQNWNPDSLASMSLGYEIGITTLQNASAFATIANGGTRIKPHIIKEIREADGNILPQNSPESVQVITPETATAMRKMLQKVVLAGTGVRAQLNGYTVIGKTGTAWKYDEKLKRINQEKYVSSFAGIAPMENSAVVIVVVLDEPKGEFRDGGHVAAPIFREIAEQILPELGVEADGTKPNTSAELITEDKGGHKVEKAEKVKKVDAPKTLNNDKKSEKSAKPTKTEVAENKPVKESKNSGETKDSKDSKDSKTLKEAKPKDEAKNKSSGKDKT
jgi:cell division protein FtsI (penicillin-binding protein 3)